MTKKFKTRGLMAMHGWLQQLDFGLPDRWLNWPGLSDCHFNMEVYTPFRKERWRLAFTDKIVVSTYLWKFSRKWNFCTAILCEGWRFDLEWRIVRKWFIGQPIWQWRIAPKHRGYFKRSRFKFHFKDSYAMEN